MSGLFFIAVLQLALAFLLFFPIYMDGDMHYDINRRKFAFAVFLYKKIPIIGGYIATYQGGFAIHLSDKKAVLIPYAQLNTERKRFSFIKTFRLKRLLVSTETGAEYLYLTSLLHTIFRAYFFIKGGKKEKIENNYWLTDGDVLRVSLQCSIRFNLFIILKNFLHYIIGRIVSLWQNKIKKSIN